MIFRQIIAFENGYLNGVNERRLLRTKMFFFLIFFVNSHVGKSLFDLTEK